MPITTTPSGGPQGEFSTYTPIYSTTISSTVSSVTLSNIPTTYTDLVVQAQIQGTSTGEDLYMQFNGDTSGSYSAVWLRGISGATTGQRQVNTSGIRLSDGGSTTTGIRTNVTANIQNYSNTTTFKVVSSRAGNAMRGTDLFTSMWRNTVPITSILFYMGVGSISAGTITIYGIKAAAPAPKATGGDSVYTNGTYWYHVFNSSGVFDVKTAMNVDYLVVAGGGGGGSDCGGGGGAGGYRTGTGLSVAAQVYTVTVGAGGAGAPSSGNAGTIGANSIFSSITATGGGGGAGRGNNNAGTGGSGGGASGLVAYSGGAASPAGQGNAGGSSATNSGGAGGGGASVAGTNATSSAGGTGGNGTANSYSGASVTYAGGGGGGRSDASSGKTAGGSGGGGSGGDNTGGSIGTAGTVNLGGGGGGGGRELAPGSGGAGGSGIVIVRYAV